MTYLLLLLVSLINLCVCTIIGTLYNVQSEYIHQIAEQLFIDYDRNPVKLLNLRYKNYLYSNPLESLEQAIDEKVDFLFSFCDFDISRSKIRESNLTMWCFDKIRISNCDNQIRFFNLFILHLESGKILVIR